GHGVPAARGRVEVPARHVLTRPGARTRDLGSLPRPAMTESKSLGVVVTVVFSLIGVLGDYFLKLASERDDSLRTTPFFVGFALYASTAFGWVFVMKHLKLATIGVVYSVSMVLLLTTVGVVFFRESLRWQELLGLAMAIGSLILLVRFA